MCFIRLPHSSVFLSFMRTAVHRFETAERYEPLFPNLRHIHHQGDLVPAVLFSQISLFAGPLLTSVTLHRTCFTLVSSEIVPPAISYHRIVNFTIGRSMTTIQATEDQLYLIDTRELLPEYSRLRAVDIALGIDGKAFKFFVELPRLTRLRVTLISSGLERACANLPFASPSLKELDMAIEDIHIATMVLQKILPTKLARIELRTKTLHRRGELAQFFQQLVDGSPQLEDVAVEVRAMSFGWTHGQPLHAFTMIMPDVFEVLFPLKRLSHLAIRLRETGMEFATLLFPFCDLDIERMAGAWPLLEILYLASVGIRVMQRPRAGLQALLSLRAKCPMLRHIALDINAAPAVSEELLAASASFKGDYPLTRLTLGVHALLDVPAISSPRVVVEVLRNFFPRLKSIDIDTHGGQAGFIQDVKSAWREIMEDIASCGHT